MKRKEILLLLLIILFGAVLRLVGLGHLGMGFFRDEAALGYNIFSILRTGRDEFGQFMPLIFRSFEVFFLPLYVYLSVPLMAVFGFSTTTSRLLSALSGTAMIGTTFLLAKQISLKQDGRLNKIFPCLAALTLAISPWSLFYSRGAFEGNLALFVFSLGALFMTRLLAGHKKALVWSLFFLTLSMYGYQSERVVMPLWVMSLFLIYRKQILPGNKIPWKSVVPAIIVGLPLIFIWFSPAGLHRAEGVSLLSPTGNVHGGVTVLIRKVAAMYSSYFSPRNLFWLGDYDQERSLIGLSVFYFWWLPALMIGIYKIFLTLKKSNKNWWLIIWLLIAPIPAALTPDPFHTYRSLMTYLPMTILIGLGLSEMVVQLIKARLWLKFSGAILLIGLTIFSLSQFISSYLFVTPYVRAWYWDEPFKQTIQILDSIKITDKKIVFDTSYSEPYIHYLFFSKYNPASLQKVTEKLPLGYYTDPSRIRFDHLDNVFFENVDWPTRRGDTDTVFIVPDTKVPPSEFITDPKVKLLATVKFPDGSVAFRFLKILK